MCIHSHYGGGLSSVERRMSNRPSNVESNLESNVECRIECRLELRPNNAFVSVQTCFMMLETYNCSRQTPLGSTHLFKADLALAEHSDPMTGIHRLSMFDVVLQGIPPRPRRTPSSSSVDDRQMDGRFGVDTDDRLDGDIDDPLAVDVDVDERLSLAKPVRASAARKMDAKSGIVIALPAN